MNEYEFNALVKKIKTDKNALAKLHAFYFRRIVYHVGKKYGQAFAEDVAQDFFLWLLHADPPHVNSPTTWVFLRCDSIAGRRAKRESRVWSLPYVEAAREEQWKKEKYGDLYEAILTLDEIDRTIVDMHYWEGYRFTEIAAFLSIPEATVRQRNRRLLKKLKKRLDLVTF